MEDQTKPKSDAIQISEHGTKPLPMRGWLIDQLTILAEAFGVAITPERLRIYASDLESIPQETIHSAFQRARRELKYFPQISELLDLCGQGAAKQEALKAAGAVEAWHRVLEIIQGWGVERWTHAVRGPCPKLDERTEYALRCVGGLHRINRATDTEFGFIQRSFMEAWELWEGTKDWSAAYALVGEMPRKTLPPASPEEDQFDLRGSAEYQALMKKLGMSREREYPADYDEQIEKRRETLRRQAEIVAEKER